MKKLLLIGAIALSLNSFSQVPSYVPTNGLVGWYNFNSNGVDASGNANNGTVNGSTSVADRFSNANSAYSFNGVDNYIEVQNSSSLQFASNLQTVSFWMKIPSIPNPVNEEAIFEKMDQHLSTDITGNSAQGFKITHGTVVISYAIKSGNGSSWVGVQVPMTLILPNQYYNVVFTNDNDSLRSYLNGVQINATEILSGTVIGANTSPFLIGKELWTSNGANMDYFNGIMDDIGIWNRALSQCEIQDIYSAQLNSTSVSAGSDQTICNGDALTLSASNSMNYSWDNGITDGVAFNPTSTQDYTVTADSAGCVSSDVVTITVNQPSTNTINETATDTYTSPSGMVYTSSGIYNDTILNSNQCDSVITINLTVEHTGIKEFSSSLVNIYPNPSSDNFKIIGIEKLKNVKTFEITSITGARVAKRDVYSSVIDISSLDKGIYLFVISHENGTEKIRFIKD